VRRTEGLPSIPGSVPSPSEDLPGCRFAPRCHFAIDQCTLVEPTLTTPSPELSPAACWNPGSGPVGVALGDAPATGAPTVEERIATGEEPLLVFENVTKAFASRVGRGGGILGLRRREQLLAVNELSLQIMPGEFFGLVGESGSGKTTLGQMVSALEDAASGTIRLGEYEHGSSGLGGKLRPFRQRVQLIFQDPQSSLDPRHTVQRIVGEPLRELTELRGSTLTNRVTELLDEVGLPSTIIDKVPSQLSGGQRQRVAIARAIAPGPSLIVADEPTSALDVSVQGQVMNLLLELRREHNLSYLFITHNLSLILSLADRVGVMKTGRLIEVATPQVIAAHPQHDYTRTLLAANPGLPPVRA